MFKNLFIAAVMGLGFTLSALPVPAPADYIYVQVGPPAPVYETVPARPGPGYVWMGGYYHWDGAHYNWVHGHYVRHSGSWCEGRWVHRAGHGWYYTDGRWC